MRTWDRIYLDLFAMRDGANTKLGCCLLKKFTERQFLLDFNRIYGPADLRCPPDAVNECVDEEFKNEVNIFTNANAVIQ